MSLFRTHSIDCPHCAKAIEFDVNFSVNADRRPDFRQAILEGSFQVESCEHCDTPFRLEPEMTYIDVSQGLWTLVRPASQRHEWPQLEADALDTFELAYGRDAGRDARAIGATLKPRVTFGWAALREKLVCAQAGLDDVSLELTKLLLMRSLPDTPLNPDTELRLGAADGEALSLAWIRFADESLVETLSVPRALYEQIAAAPQEWQSLRDELGAGSYVDVTRLLVETEAG